jgi:hypothetical protein
VADGEVEGGWWMRGEWILDDRTRGQGEAQRAPLRVMWSERGAKRALAPRLLVRASGMFAWSCASLHSP